VVHPEVRAVHPEIVQSLRQVDGLPKGVAGAEHPPAAQRAVVSEREGAEALHDGCNDIEAPVFR
jgi:hypothetical protein